MVTANLAAYFVQTDRDEQGTQEKLDEALARLARLEKALQLQAEQEQARDISDDPSPPQ